MAAGELYISTKYDTLAWRTSSDAEKRATGTNLIRYNAVGSVWIEGVYLFAQYHSSLAKQIAGAASNRSADTPGKLYVDAGNGYLYYHDANGAARYVVG